MADRKRCKDGNTKIWISRKRKEMKWKTFSIVSEGRSFGEKKKSDKK